MVNTYSVSDTFLITIDMICIVDLSDKETVLKEIKEYVPGCTTAK